MKTRRELTSPIVDVRDDGREYTIPRETGPGGPGPPGPDGPDGAPAFGAFQQDYVATPGQTVFPLPAAPTNPALVLMIVDHLCYYPTKDFTISGLNVTWLGLSASPPNFNMIGGEDVRIYF